jgi:DNA-binding winged helix-turn-helix (wHTH) protein
MRDANCVVPSGNSPQPAVPAPQRRLDFGAFALDLDGRMLIDSSGREIELRRREFDLLETLARCPGRVMSREVLLDAIAGREADVFDRTIDVYVGRLRRKIEADPRQPRLILTVPGIGYRFAAKAPLADHFPKADQVSDEAVRQAQAGIIKYFNQAHMERDARAVSGLYAEDATIVHPGGRMCGRASIEEAYQGYYRECSASPSTLGHVVMIGNDMMLRAGTWSHTLQGPGGVVHRRGSWTTTDLLRGATWQIQTETILVHSEDQAMDRRR